MLHQRQRCSFKSFAMIKSFKNHKKQTRYDICNSSEDYLKASIFKYIGITKSVLSFEEAYIGLNSIQIFRYLSSKYTIHVANQSMNYLRNLWRNFHSGKGQISDRALISSLSLLQRPLSCWCSFRFPRKLSRAFAPCFLSWTLLPRDPHGSSHFLQIFTQISLSQGCISHSLSTLCTIFLHHTYHLIYYIFIVVSTQKVCATFI